MKIKKRLITGILMFVVLLVIGTNVYHYIEKWNYLDSAYFSVITATTIGYGDFTPKTDAGKVFTIIYALSGISIVLYMLSLVGRSLLGFEFRNKLKERKGVIKIKKAR